MFSNEPNPSHYRRYGKTIQGKICLYTTAILALLICIYGILAYTELRSDLLYNARLGLEARVSPVIHHVAETNSGSFAGYASDLITTLRWHGVESMVVDVNRKWVVGDKQVGSITGNQPVNYSYQKRKWFLTCTFPLSWQGKEAGFLIARTSLQHVAQTLQRERNLLLVGGMLVLGAAYGLSFILTRKVLLPLQALRQTAHAIARNEMDARATVTGQSYEINELITAFNSMLDRLQEAFIGQQKANLQVKQFMADASHELRSPLTAVSGYLEIIQQGAVDTPEEQERVFTAAKRELKRLNRLVDNLLTLARLESGLPLEKQQVNLPQLLREAAQRAADLDPDREIVVEAKEGYVFGDIEKLRQLINNLVDNALLHSGDKSRIELGCSPQLDKSRFWIKDNGIGIESQDLSLIFNRFWRGAGRTGLSRGTGLGLSIVQAIVDAHGGSIEVISSPGQGTCFVVTLPG